MRSFACAVLLLALAAGEACAQSPDISPARETILAQVNDQAITRRDLDEALAIDGQWHQALKRGASVQDRRELERRTLDLLIDETLFLKECERRGLKLSPEEKKRAELKFEDLSRQIAGSVESFEEALKGQGVRIERVRQRHEATALIRNLIVAETARDTFVRPCEIVAYFDEHQDEWREKGGVQLRVLQVDKSGPGRDEARARAFAEELLARIQKGEDFAALARANSDGAQKTREDGGLVNLMTKTEYTPVAHVTKDMKEGDLSDVIEARTAFYIVRLEKVSEDRVKTIGEVEEEIRKHILSQRQQERIDQLRKELRDPKRNLVLIYFK